MSKKRGRDGFNTPFHGLADKLAAQKVAEQAAEAAAQAAAQKAAAARVTVTPTPRRAQPIAPATPRFDEHLADDALFLREVQGTTPLGTPEKRGPRVPGQAPREPRPARSDDAEVLAALADLVDGAGTFDITDGDEYIEGLADGADRRLLKRLRAGEYAIQAHLDLHGLTREDARAEVARFLVESRRAGRRCVLIVHGRGLHSKDQLPVLKEAVRSWLERGALSRAVLAFATARPHDGGAGAVYVLLRR